MKPLVQFIKEDIFTTPANTIGIGGINMPTTPNTTGGSGDMGLCCIDIKTGKLYKRRKKFRRYKI